MYALKARIEGLTRVPFKPMEVAIGHSELQLFVD